LRLYSYIVTRDYGFAPNPFYGVCTLACCKPIIRASAALGDWIVGTGSQTSGRRGKLVYAMRVTETLSFDEYWNDARFRTKQPNLAGSMKQAFGDNIYHRLAGGAWRQLNSHHSYADGTPNQHNVVHDTQTPRVLASDDFAYWGGSGPDVPGRFRDYEGFDICAIRGHKCVFSENLVREFDEWMRSIGERGYLGEPLDWAG
jgi:hypothetical protein